MNKLSDIIFERYQALVDALPPASELVAPWPDPDFEVTSIYNDRDFFAFMLKHRQALSEWIDASTPCANSWAKYNGPTIEFFGPTFHKGFRQCDVLPTGRDDMYMYGAMAARVSEAPDNSVWDILAESCAQFDREKSLVDQTA